MGLKSPCWGKKGGVGLLESEAEDSGLIAGLSCSEPLGRLSPQHHPCKGRQLLLCSHLPTNMPVK